MRVTPPPVARPIEPGAAGRTRVARPRKTRRNAATRAIAADVGERGCSRAPRSRAREVIGIEHVRNRRSTYVDSFRTRMRAVERPWMSLHHVAG
jgi:hypothetical protein